MILIAILALAFMIIVHEWGHFIAGRICKIPVYEFSVGMGPVLLQKKGKKETVYSLRAIPLGGFCAFDKGDATGVMDSNLNKLSIPKRLFIFIAGPLMNIITAFVIMFIVIFFIGSPAQTATIEKVLDGTVATVELQQGDKIIEVNGIAVNGNRDEVVRALSSGLDKDKKEDQTAELVVDRNGEHIATVLTLAYDEETGMYSMGYTLQTVYEKEGLLSSLRYSARGVLVDVKMVYESLFGLITGKYKVSQMSGVVGVVSVMSEVINDYGIYYFLMLAAFISANLGVANMLPIPGLDGSKVLFALIEAVRGKPMERKTETIITMIGVSLLLVLFVSVTINDVFTLLKSLF